MFSKLFRWLESLADPFQSYAEHTPPSGVWAYIATQLAPFRKIIALSLALTLITVAIEIWLIGYAGRLVDALAATSPQQLWASHGTELIIVALVILILRPLAPLIREGLDDIAFKPSAATMIRWRAHRHVLQQPVGWFQDERAGRLANRVVEVGSTAAGAVYAVIHTLVWVLAYILGSLWLMATVDLRLVIPLLVWLVAYFALMAWAVPRFNKTSEGFQSARSALSGMVVDAYANIATIKLFSSRTHEDRESRDHFAATRDRFNQLQRVEVIINSTMIFLGSLLIIALVGYAIILWQADAATLGTIAAAIALSFRISAMAEWLLDAVSSLFGHIGSVRDSLKSIAQPLAIADADNAGDIRVTGGAITLTAVSHHYGKGAGGLNNLSLNIAPGEKVGLVGRSGAGKSTLVNLILRFFEGERGLITVDGQDITAVTQDSLRAQIGMVTQESALLHRSVRDNISYGQSIVSDEALHDAARKAEAHDFILGLEDGEGRKAYDAHVGERGVKLSGGQRQRVALARVILKNAPILILDEATSALDSEVEAAIQDTLDTLMQGKTTIAIAHRLSTIARMDRIVVLDEGRVAEQGTHDDLLKSGGIYARLWSRQSGGYIGNE